MRQPSLTPRTALLAVAGILTCATAGIAAISDNIDHRAAQPAAETQAPQAATPAEAATAAPIPPAAPVAEAGVAQAPAAQPQWVPALTAAADADSSEQYNMRIPFTNRTIKVTVRTFPSSPSEVGETAPSVVAYFEQKNGNRQLAGASGPVFPSAGGEDDWRPSPAVIAYFERVEANHLAALKAQQAATAAAAAALAQPASPETPAAAPTAAVGATPLQQVPGG